MKKIKVLLLTLVAFFAICAFACKPKETKNPTKEPTVQPVETPSDVPTPVTYDLTSAVNYVKNMYKGTDGSATPGDYTVIAIVVIKGDTYQIEWSVNVTSGNADDVKVIAGNTETTIDVNEKAAEAGEYTLTATIKAPDGTSADVSFKHNFPKYNLMSWEDYMAAAKDAAIDIKGVLVGAIKSSDTAINLYLEDNDGGYYVYAMPLNGASVEDFIIGATYEVVGTKDDYYGTAEIVSATATKLDDEVIKVEPINVNDRWEAATAATDSCLSTLLGMYVQITGVTMKDISTDKKYINFTRGEDALTSYVYISTSSNFVTADEIQALYDKCIKGRTATITGLGYLYNGAFYVIPMTVDAITLDALPEKSAQEKVDDAKNAINELEGTVVTAQLEFPKAAYDDITLTWDVEENDYIDKTGKVLSYPLEEQEVEFTCTIACGEITDTVTVTVKVAALAVSNIADLDWSNTDDTFIIEGIIIGADKYTDFYVADKTGVVYVYTKLPDGIKVGDSVKVVGKLTVYGINKGQVTKEFMPSSVTKIEEISDRIQPVIVDLKDMCTPIYANEITDNGAAALASRYQGGIYTMTGYVKEVTSGSYINYYLCSENDENSAKLIYNYTNSSDDINLFAGFKDKMVSVVAPIHDYSVSYGGWRIGPALSIEAVTGEPEIPTAANTCAELYTKDKGFAATVVGTVIYVYQGNGFLLADETGAIYVYDKKAPKFHAGDILSVSGAKDAYNGIAEIVAPSDGAVKYSLIKIQPNYEYDYVEKTFDEFLNLTNDAANFGIGIKMTATLVKGSYINVKTGEGTTTNLYLSNDDKLVVGALFPEEATELTLTGVFYTYQYKNNCFMVFLDVNTIELD